MSAFTPGSTLGGNGWTALMVAPGRWVVSIATEAELMAGLNDFVAAAGIQSGDIAGVGACHKVILSFRNPVTKAYDDTEIEEQMEITNLRGNIYQIDQGTKIHVHGTFGRQDLSARAGHVKALWIRGAGEISITADEVAVVKVPDAATGLNIYKLR